jgi:hypothetical protein
MCPRAASAQSDSKKASKVSFAWKRRNGVPTGKIFANASEIAKANPGVNLPGESVFPIGSVAVNASPKLF